MAVAALVGTIKITKIVAYPLIVVAYNATAPAPIPVLLSNGFYLAPDWDSAKSGARHILDENRQEIIASDVRYIMTHGEWVYGYRSGPAYERYYFICKAGEDCSGSQRYLDTEFEQLVEEYGLPKFDGEKMKNYRQLLDEQVDNGIDTSYGGV